MQIKVQVVIEDSEITVRKEITCLHKKGLSPETLGLTLDEGKKILSNLQELMTSSRINGYISQFNICPTCGGKQSIKDATGKIVF